MKRLALCLIVFVVFSSPVFAKYSGGEGTPSNPYIINSPGDLVAMAADANDYTSHFKQTADINLLGTVRSTAFIAPDTSTSDGFQGNKFLGTYDGQSYEIQNFAIDTAGGGQDYLGLFGCIGNNAVVRNVKLVNCNIQGDSGSDNCGGIAGQNNFNIIGCEVSGVVTGHNNIGGICGYNVKTISRCHSTVNASGNDNVGSLCGYNEGAITKSSAIGSASGHDNVGGLCGFFNSGTISQCSSAGKVSGNLRVGGLCGSISDYGTTSFAETFSSGDVNGDSYVGGFIGQAYIHGHCSTSIKDCFALGDVDATGDYIGGFAGQASRWYNGSGSIGRCYAKGSVNGGRYIGGFIGAYSDYVFSLYNCYSTGVVTGISSVGGFCGSLSGSVMNCLWDIDSSLITTSSGGTGKTTAEMYDIQTFIDAGWRISEDVLWYYWYQPVNDYPRLVWELSKKVPDLSSMSRTNAEAMLNQEGFTAGQVIYQFNEDVAADTVVGQYPTAGMNRKPGTSIHLVVTADTPRHYSGGAGTGSDPLIIAGINDLLTLANNKSDYNKNFKLVTDIDMSGWNFVTGLIAPASQAFTGSFDGGSHRILNLHLYPDVNGRNNLGLFGKIGSLGKVYNLNIENGYIDNRWNTNYISLLCGYNYGLIERCSSSGLIKGGNYAGGICGRSDGTISDCRSSVEVKAYDSVASLCGYNQGTITRSSAIGSASGHYNVGGLCGYYYGGTISYCNASGQADGNRNVGGMVGRQYGGNIYESWSLGSANGVDNIGGFVGYAGEYGKTASISDCYARGDVLSEGSNAGGFAGLIDWSTISRSYTAGEVSGINDVGGFVGYTSHSNIYNSYSTGVVTGSSNVGGFRGRTYESGVYNCFWDIDSSLLTTSNGGTGKTTAEMQDIQTYIDAGWRISKDVLWYYWYMPAGSGYPKLSWEIIAQKVPDLANLMQPEALTAITDEQFTVGRIIYQYNDQLPIGTVVNQYPKAGLNRAVGSPVDIVVTGLSDPNYSGGNGQELTPFEISDVNDLLTLANNPLDWTEHFILTADIDLKDWAFTTALISPDTSTADGYQGTMFEGSFNGNQHVIRNLILYPEVSGRGDLGLFGRVADTGQISDLGIENFKLDNRWSGSWNSGLCAVNYGTITNCYTVGDIKCSSYAGGLCGYSSGTITDSYSTVIISGNEYLGGLVGRNDTGALITNCHAVVDIRGSNYLGGLTGHVKASTITDSFATYKVFADDKTGIVSGRQRVGGLIGYLESGSNVSQSFANIDIKATDSYSGGFAGYSSNSTISRCASYGYVEGVNYSGGFAGYIYRGSLNDSYSTGWVLGNNYVGGFIGSNSCYVSVNRCYSIGSVVGGSTAVNVGGFSGAGCSTDCFWDTDTSFMDSSSSGTGLISAQLTDMSTYSDAGWSIGLEGTDTTWKIAADSYPWLSWETDVYLIPGLVGKAQTDAETQILDLGYNVGTVSNQYSDTVPVGQVISQYPPAGAVTVLGASIDLVISSGLADVPVPYVVGMQQSQAENMIIYSKLQVGTITFQASSSVPAGTVISQSPAAGTQVSQQSFVEIVVSNGSGGSVIPNVTGLEEQEAIAIIEAEGFVHAGSILQYSSVFPKGYVISSDPAAGTSALPAEEVTLVVSDGPQPIVVPSFVGMNEISAIIEIFVNGLTLGITTYRYSDSVQAGIVISQQPIAGQTVKTGSAVDLVISLGATPVSVPTVVGLQKDTAVNQIIAANLFIGIISEKHNDAVAEGIVYSQSPLPGSEVPASTTVDLWVSLGPNILTVPSVIGNELTTAVTKLKNDGLIAGTILEQYNDDVAVNSVISQSPDPGTEIEVGAAVDLIVSKGPAPCIKPDWSAPYGSNVMVIYAKIEVNGIPVTEPSSMLGAFMGGVSAGFAEVSDEPTGTVYQLIVTSENTSGQISFKVFDKVKCKVYVIDDKVEFVPGAVSGSLIEPVQLYADTLQLRSDINHDGIVDVNDFKIMAAEWLMSTKP